MAARMHPAGVNVILASAAQLATRDYALELLSHSLRRGTGRSWPNPTEAVQENILAQGEGSHFIITRSSQRSSDENWNNEFDAFRFSLTREGKR